MKRLKRSSQTGSNCMTKLDKYLELFGIMPTLQVLRERMRAMFRLPCVDTLALQRM